MCGLNGICFTSHNREVKDEKKEAEGWEAGA
jgi:hypothetical protein